MMYLEYEEVKRKYHKAQKHMDEILTEQEQLFVRTLPKAITYDKDHVQCSPYGEVLEDYMIAKEEKHIDDRLRKMRRVILDRQKLLDDKERELRRSREIIDMVYTFRFLDGMGINRISRLVNCSRASVYRALREIKKNLKVETF